MKTCLFCSNLEVALLTMRKRCSNVQFELFLFCSADPDLQQDPAFRRFCLSTWSLQELLFAK